MQFNDIHCCLVLVIIIACLCLTVVLADKPPEVSMQNNNEECIANDDGTCKDYAPSSITSVYVIGDLHGDAKCAVSWVNRTGLVANLIKEDISSSEPLFKQLNDPSEWKWTNDKATLVFMGDYVDKGPTAKQTVELVKDLTETFPDKVTAILGNHELELLRDRDAKLTPVEKYSAYSYAVVHPGDYHNYMFNVDEDDHLVLDQLLEASMEVYAHNAHSVVRMVPGLPTNSDVHTKRGIKYAITDIIPPQHRLLAQERLAEYQTAYLNTFRSGSSLGQWMERRPIAHYAEDIKTLFVHGGVNYNTGKSYFMKGKEDVDKLNSVWWEHSNEENLYNFLEGKGMTKEDGLMGYVVYELLTYRGNHPGYANWESHGTYDDGASEDDDKVCKTLYDMLSYMNGIDRIAVGHTPESDVRILCKGKFLALDSMLGRWIRGSGNMYCAGPEHFESRKDHPKSSRDGRFTCDDIKETCDGQITRLDSDGSVNILTM